MNTARRPDIFDREHIEEFLREKGCAESMISPVISDLKLFVPVVFAKLGADAILDLMEGAREQLGLGPQREFWRTVAKYAALWGQDCVDTYRAQKLGSPEGS